MIYADKRAEGIANLRQWARGAINDGATLGWTYLALTAAMQALQDEFLVEHDMPGTRYWHHPESNDYFVSAPGRAMHHSDEIVELSRAEFIGRNLLHFGYEDRL